MTAAITGGHPGVDLSFLTADTKIKAEYTNLLNVGEQ